MRFRVSSLLDDVQHRNAIFVNQGLVELRACPQLLSNAEAKFNLIQFKFKPKSYVSSSAPMQGNSLPGSIENFLQLFYNGSNSYGFPLIVSEIETRGR